MIGSGFALVAPALPTIASNALNGPAGTLRNQKSMQDQHGAYGRGEATEQKCFVFPNTLMNGCFAPTTIYLPLLAPVLRSTPTPQARAGRPSAPSDRQVSHDTPARWRRLRSRRLCEAPQRRRRVRNPTISWQLRALPDSGTIGDRYSRSVGSGLTQFFNCGLKGCAE